MARHVERDAGGVGGARRRRERRLCSWWRHERMSVAAALVSASHHSAQPGGLESHFAPLGQTNTGASGRRPAALKEPGPPQLVVVRAACPRTTVPSLTPAVLGGGSDGGVDSSALRFLMAATLEGKRREKEEEEKREVAKHIAVQEEAAEAMHRARLLLKQAGKRRKRKKRKKRLPRGPSSVSVGCLVRQRIHVASPFRSSVSTRPLYLAVLFGVMELPEECFGSGFFSAGRIPGSKDKPNGVVRFGMYLNFGTRPSKR